MRMRRGRVGLVANIVFSLAATAMQHLCLAKALMLIRETEVYENSHEQRVEIKVKIGCDCDALGVVLMLSIGTNY
jgi:hypothetical protein